MASTEKCSSNRARSHSPYWRWVPVLMRPRVLTLWRSLIRSSELPGSWLKNLLLVLFGGILLIGIVESTTAALSSMATTMPAYRLSTVPAVQLVYLALFIVLMLSSLVGALATLFLSKDLELVLAAPVPRWRFFLGKLSEVVVVSAWVPLLLVIPILVAIGAFFNAPIQFYGGALIALLLSMVLASASAMAIVAVVAWMVPAAQFRKFIVAFGLIALVFGYLMLHYALPPEIARKDVSEVVREFVLSKGSAHYTAPWGHVALFLESLRQSDFRQAATEGGVLLFMTGFALVAAFSLLSVLFEHAFSKARSLGAIIRINSRNSQRRLIAFLFYANPSTRALVAKELKLFSRDMIQALQLLVLLGLCVVYLYNFQILRAAGEFATLTAAARLWWEGGLVLLNIVIGGIVTATVCMRFVFPTVSLEGQAMWILQKSPLSARELLRAKFWCWLIPLGLIMSVIMVCGALAIQAEPRIVAVSGLVSWILCYGIVGMAVGMGAVFANFNWDHPAQVTASLGALLYLLASTTLVVASAVPAAALVFLRTARAMGVEFGSLRWTLLVSFASAVLVLGNVLAQRWAMRMGAEALSRT